MLDAREVLAGLRARSYPLGELDAPGSPGIYAFFLAQGAELPGIAQPSSGALYLGKSSNLAQREFDTHFRAGQSGFSTLRRSLGALLLVELDLKPRPRGTGSSDSNFRNYRFDDAGERRLSDWMERNLMVAVQATPDPAEIERQLIALACPPLNLTGWSNPDGAAIKAARKACVAAARATALR